MSTTNLIPGGSIIATVAVLWTQLDLAAFLTVMLSVVISMVGSWLTYKVAIRQLKKETKDQIAEISEQLHAIHGTIQAAKSDTAKKD